MNSRKELLVDSDQKLALTSDDAGQLYLEVVCGGVAMENVVIPLSSDDLARFRETGKCFLEELALRVRKNRDQFDGRIVR